MADMSGRAKTFFTYQHQWELCEWHTQVKKAIAWKKITKLEAAEWFREKVYNAAFYGREAVFNMANLTP